VYNFKQGDVLFETEPYIRANGFVDWERTEGCKMDVLIKPRQQTTVNTSSASVSAHWQRISYMCTCSLIA